MLFVDRADAAERLADRLRHGLAPTTDLVLGIPRGGIVVGAMIAHRLGLPLGVCPVRKVGAPENPELAVGAVDPESTSLVDRQLLARLGLDPANVEREAVLARAALLAWMEQLGPAAFPSPRDREVILVDDGIATGATAGAAVGWLRRCGARRITLATPVAPPDTVAALSGVVDLWICLATPEPFVAVGNFFQSWPQVDDGEVRRLLTGAAAGPSISPPAGKPT